MVDSISNTSLVRSAIDHAMSMDISDKMRAPLLSLITPINPSSS